MEIKNVTQFCNFIKSNNLTALDSVFSQIITCINNYAASCNCHKVQDKQKIYDNCNRLYTDAVRNIVPKFKNVILPKIPEGRISFYVDNGGLISILSR